MLIFPDNTVLVHFAEIGRVDLLRQWFSGNARWTATVESECEKSSRLPHLTDLLQVPSFMGESLFPNGRKERIDMESIRLGFAGPDDHPEENLGEAETLSIISNRQLEARLITDDKAAYRYAVAEGIKSMTTWDVLKLSHRVGLIDFPTAWGYVSSLKGPRTRYSELRTPNLVRPYGGRIWTSAPQW